MPVNPLATFYRCVVPLFSKYTEGQYARQSPDRTLKRQLTLSAGYPFLPKAPPRAPKMHPELQTSARNQLDYKRSLSRKPREKFGEPCNTTK